ncbi:hypothetical protein [Amycolatopsis sp. MtRt-6]|uniref:hypothetical protein n=1 Tax=Amycolatopsis sp. MtRt-6 TaxID=2792782 RepID=UPI001F5D8DBA|nr:hypothetical protein [Amycolatopsis sp. MtRt-6]
MPERLGLVAVAGLADVPALADVGAGASPGLFEGVQDLVLGDGLIDPALQDPLGPAARDTDGLVRREQRDLAPLQVSFDRESLIGPARDSRDALADDDVEPAVRSRSLGQQVGDAAVAGDGDVEAFVVVSAATPVQFHPPGLDVVEVRDDDPGFGQSGLGVAQLTQDRLAWILLLLCGGSPQEGDADLVSEQGQRHAQGRDRVVGQSRWTRDTGPEGLTKTGPPWSRRVDDHTLGRIHGYQASLAGSADEASAAQRRRSAEARASRARNPSALAPLTSSTRPEK